MVLSFSRKFNGTHSHVKKARTPHWMTYEALKGIWFKGLSEREEAMWKNMVEARYRVDNLA